MTWQLRAVLAVMIAACASPVAAAERLCDASFENCRAPLIELIQNENVGIDVAFWFMQDARYQTEIIRRWQAGVPVRVIVDPLANPSYAGNEPILAALAAAGIPMRARKSTAPGILHWKMMLFAGQNTVEFSGANFSPTAFVPEEPYVNFEDEVIYFCDDPAVVQSFMTKYDDLWLDTTYYVDFANIANPPARVYPTYPKDPELNFPQQENFADRILKRYPKELQQIDIVMYRITDERHTNALIAAHQRGIPVRLISDMYEYRTPKRQWVSYNLDRLWTAGIALKVRAHLGLNHQKVAIFYRNQPSVGAPAPLSVFGSSNFTTPSASLQQEHNYFTQKLWIFDWFVQMFERKWNNTNPVGSIESDWFVPQKSDKPINLLPANGAINLNTTGQFLKWDPGFFAHYYDIYFGVDPNPPLYKENLKLGPVDYDTPKTKKTFTLPALQPGTTYYWYIVSKTMAGLTNTGLVWSFTTKGTPPPPPPPPPGATTQVIWAADVPPSGIVGAWSLVDDPTAAGGKALFNPDKGKSKISPALAEPVNYFETTFTAMSGVPYHLWIRMRAQNNSVNNAGVSVQFNDSVDAFGTAHYEIGSPTGAEVVLQDGTSGTISGWGWADNGYGNFGPDIYFATTGTHTMRVQVRNDGSIVDQIVLSPDVYVRSMPGTGKNDPTILGSTISGAPGGLPPPLPDPWQRGDVGTVAINGMARYDETTGVFSLNGDGGDIWNTADGMYYAYQPLSGDGSIVARVTGVENSHVWARGGVMIRETMAAGSPNAFMYWSAGKVLAFQRRLTTGGTTFATLGSTNTLPPRWLRLDRAGDVFTAYQSIDGVIWVFVGSDTIVMPPNVYIGLAAASGTLLKTTRATFDNVMVTPGLPAAPMPPPTPPPLPDGWLHQDIGAVGFTGDTTFDAATSIFTVKGAGNDVWGAADAFHYAYRSLVGDGFIVARVRSLQNTSTSAKAGVMIRETVAANAANAYMAITPGKGTAFQRRVAAGGATVSQVGSLDKAPYWVKLERIGDVFNAYQSPDGTAWTLVGSETIPMGPAVHVGLAVVSRSVFTASAAGFEFVSGSW